MFKNYAKSAYRALSRHPGYTAIVVAGLAVSVACCLLVGRWVAHEVSYDRYHEDADRVFALSGVIDGEPRAVVGAATGLLARGMPGVEEVVRVFRAEAYVSTGEGGTTAQTFREPGALFADPASSTCSTSRLRRGALRGRWPSPALLC